MSLLSQQNQMEYQQKGYTRIRGFLLPAQLNQLRAECEHLAAQLAQSTQLIPEAALRQDLEGNPVRDRLDPVMHLSPVIQQIIYDARLKATLSEIFLNEPLLFKDKLIFKPAGTTGYDLHQDFAYWEQTGMTADGVLSVQVAIDPADAQNGAIIFYPSLHRDRLPAPNHAPRDVCPAAVKGVPAELVETQPGDILIFHSLTPHRSQPNLSPHPRRTLYLTYNASRYGDFYRSYYGDRLKGIGLQAV